MIAFSMKPFFEHEKAVNTTLTYYIVTYYLTHPTQVQSNVRLQQRSPVQSQSLISPEINICFICQIFTFSH